MISSHMILHGHFDMEPLDKPRKGKILHVGRLIMHFNWAKSWLWAKDSSDVGDDSPTRRTELFSIFIMERNGQQALSFVFGPLKIIGGYISTD